MHNLLTKLFRFTVEISPETLMVYNICATKPCLQCR